MLLVPRGGCNGAAEIVALRACRVAAEVVPLRTCRKAVAVRAYRVVAEDVQLGTWPPFLGTTR